MTDIPDGWEIRGKPPTLFRRFEFPRYAATRDFLDALASLSAAHDLHPQNINFGTSYANVSLEFSEGDAGGVAACEFARRINEICPQQSRPV